MLGKFFLRVLVLGSGFIGPLEASFPEEKDPDFYADRTQRETPHSKKWDAKNLRKKSPPSVSGKKAHFPKRKKPDPFLNAHKRRKVSGEQ